MSVIIEKASAKDNTEICKLCEIPMDGSISLSIERNPDYFIGAKVQNEIVQIFICKDTTNDEIVGLFSVGKRKVFNDGTPLLVSYLSDLRIHPNFQNSLLLVRIFKFIKEKELIKSDELAQAIIFSDNNTMLDLMAKTKAPLIKKYSLPKAYLLGEYNSYMISLSKKRKNRHSLLNIRKAQISDFTIMQDFFNTEAAKKQWYPIYNFNELKSDYYHNIKPENFYLAFNKDELVGITGIWDQGNFKQTKVHSYSTLLSFVKPIINAKARLIGGFRLPELGQKINYLLLHTIVTKKNDESIFSDLVDQIYNDNYGTHYNYFLCGLDKKDNLNSVLKNYQTKRIIYGKLYLVSYNQSPDIRALSSKLYYIEAARI